MQLNRSTTLTVNAAKPALCISRCLQLHTAYGKPCTLTSIRQASKAQVVHHSNSTVSQKRLGVCSAAPVSAGKLASDQHLQLATAQLPSNVDTTAFAGALYQWAATLTSNGGNYPFALPLKTDKLSNGFQISMLKRVGNSYDSAGVIEATVEPVGKDQILFVRFYEGPASMADRRTAAPTDPTQRLEVTLQSLVDVQTIMQTMPGAIRGAVKASSR